MANRHVIIVVPADDPLADGWNAIDPFLHDTLGRGVYGFWESQIVAICQRRGITRTQLQNQLTARGCVWVIRDATEYDPATPNSGDLWKLTVGWTDAVSP